MIPSYVVYGVTNWDDQEDATYIAPDLCEWRERVRQFLPNAQDVFLTTGSYSPPEYNPIAPTPIYQLPLYRFAPYSRKNNYFRSGFITGIWKALLDYDTDLIIHCQCRHLLGEDLTPYIQEFMERPEMLMAPRFSSVIGTAIDVGLLIMERQAALMYAVTGHRQSMSQVDDCINCEEEAYLLFGNTWYNPWDSIQSVKQFDIPARVDGIFNSPYEINDIEYYKTLPFVANGKHASNEYLAAWRTMHPI